MKCTECKLHSAASHACIMGQGKQTARVMFIQDCPDEGDDHTGVPFSGKSCTAVKTALSSRGINSVNDVYFTSMVKCMCEDKEVPLDCVSACTPILEAEIEVIDPDIIVPMGNRSLKYCLGRVGLTKVRGNAQEVEIMGRTRIVLPTMHPRMVLKKPAYKDQILRDMDTLKELFTNGMTQVTDVDYRYLETIEDVTTELTRMKREAKRIVFDLETTGKSSFMDYSKIVCISLTDKPRYGVVIPLYKHDSPFSLSETGYIVKLLRWVLEDPSIPKSAHNGKFDIEWLKAWLDINVANFDFDTIFGHYIAISEEQGTQGLKSQAWEFTDMGGYDNELDEFTAKLSNGEGAASKFNYDRVPWNILRTYAAADVDCCYRLVDIYKPMIDGNDMWKTLMEDILMPASYALRDIEINGMRIDMDLAQQYSDEYDAEVRRIVSRLETYPEVLAMEREKRQLALERERIKLIPPKDRTPEEKKKFGELKKYENYKFNWNSVYQLRELLYDRLQLVTTVTTDKGEPSTNEEAMEEIKDQHEIPTLLLELRKVTTLNNMFIKKLPAMRDGKDIIHSSFNLTGTVTGRLSSENPNFQQLPRKSEENPLLFQYHHEPKALFVSRFGSEGCILNADYCLAPDTKVALINGECDTIQSICERLTKGENLYTYSVNPQTEDIVVSKILAGRKTRKNESTLKITLDNGEVITCSYNHKFMLRNGEYTEAQNLIVGNSLMGFYSAEYISDYGVTYRFIGINKNFMTQKSEHQLVYQYFRPTDYVNGKPIHHIDGNGMNNDPSNLQQISFSEHMSIHMQEFWDSLTPEERSELNKSHVTDKTRQKIGENSRDWWKSLTPEEYKAFCVRISEWALEHMKSEGNPMWGKKHKPQSLQVMSEKRTAHNLSCPLEVRQAMSKRMYEGRILKIAQEILQRGGELKSEEWERQRAQHYRPPTWKTALPVLLARGLITNHKIISIEPGESMDLYDIQVENFENFALSAGIFVHNCALEMRIAAIISDDKKMTQAFLSGSDIHKANASYIWRIPIEEVTKDLRTKAKSLGFGIIYGKSGITFAKELYYDPSGTVPGKTDDWDEAKREGFDLVEHFLGTFDGLGRWLERTKKFAYKHGYVETMFGRRRRLPDLHSRVSGLKSNAERQAINAPIQGTGSDLTMLSVIQINNWLKKNRLRSLIVATVHDSIVLDVYLPELSVVGPMVKRIMEHVHEPYIDTEVPILAELEMGINYGATFEVAAENCQKMTTISDFNCWVHDQSLVKYRKEIDFFKKHNWNKQQVLQYLEQYHRPIRELVNYLEQTFEGGV